MKPFYLSLSTGHLIDYSLPGVACSMRPAIEGSLFCKRFARLPVLLGWYCSLAVHHHWQFKQAVAGMTISGGISIDQLEAIQKQVWQFINRDRSTDLSIRLEMSGRCRAIPAPQ